MPVEIVMPRLSDTMDRGTVARWLKREGEEVKKGEALAEIETDKATLPLESFYNGRIGRIMLAEGESAPIGEPIATIVRPGENADVEPYRAGASPTNPEPFVAPPALEPAAASVAPSATTAPSANPPSADEPPLTSASTLSPGGASPNPPRATSRPGAASPFTVPASPLARRVAEELGVDLGTVRGTGPNGRVTREDVEEAARAARGAPTAASTSPAPSGTSSDEAPAPEGAPAPSPVEHPLTRMQETIARRMVQSTTTVPHFYVTIEVDVSALMDLRARLNETWSDTRVGVEDLIVKALGIALTDFPIVNASWRSDRLVYHQQVNVGVAVAVENGLLVPVLHDLQAKTLRMVAKEIKALRERARDGKALAQDFQGGTFTVSNLGPYGVDEFLAIVNPPESGILALGGIERKPIVRDNAIVVSQRLRLSLSADHRVFYGAVAAQFLARVRELLEKPLALLA